MHSVSATNPMTAALTIDQAAQGKVQSAPTDPGTASCEKNRHFISDTLATYVANTKNVLEIGAGYGIHAVHFARRFPQLTWHITDQKKYHALVAETFRQLGKPENVTEPIDLDISRDEILPNTYDALYTSNTLHCMPIEEVILLFQKAGKALLPNALFFVYGPFNLKPGVYSTPSNKAFDEKISNPALGGNPLHRLRDIPTVEERAQAAGFTLVGKHDHTESNNFLLVFQKIQ